MLVRDIAFFAMFLVGAVFVASLLVCKRSDVSWGTFFLAGPMVVVRPSRYLRADRMKVPPTLFVLMMILFWIAWIASWFVNNR